MKTQYYTACSLDGFIAAPGDSLDWLFTLGDIAETSYPTFIKDVGALAMGSSTYEWMLRHVIGPDADHPEPWPYHQSTWVFTSRALPGIPGADIRFVRGDVRPVHAEMVRRRRQERLAGRRRRSRRPVPRPRPARRAVRPIRLGHTRRRQATAPAHDRRPAAQADLRPADGDGVRRAALRGAAERVTLSFRAEGRRPGTLSFRAEGRRPGVEESRSSR